MKATLPTFTCSESSNHKYFAPENFRGAKYSWFSWLKVWPRIHKWSDLADLYLQWKQQPQIFCPRKFSWSKIFVVFVVEGLTTNVYPQMKATLPTFTCSESSNHKYFAPEIFVGQNIRGFRGWRSDHECILTNEATLPTFTCSESNNHKYFAPEIFRGAKYSWFSWLKVWPRMFTHKWKRPCLLLPAVKAATTNIIFAPNFSWGKIFVVFVVEGLTTNVYPQMKATVPTFTCSESSNHKYFCPQNFRGAKYSWFSWLKVWPRIFYHKWSDLAYFYLQWKQQPQIFCPRNFRGAKYSWFSWLKVWPRMFTHKWKRPCLLLPAVKAATTNILPPKFCPRNWGQNIRGFRGWRSDHDPQMKRPCRPLPAVKAATTNILPPKIFVEQNIRGFRGWRSDHEYFTYEWSDLAYLYLQWKQQPQIFCPRNFRGAKFFFFFFLNFYQKFFTQKKKPLPFFFLQWKQQPKIFCPRNFRGAKYSWFSWLKVWPRIHKWSDLADLYLQWKQQPQIFCPRNFRGAKYSWFSWLKVWPRMFTHKWKRPCLLLPAVKAATTISQNILPPKFSWGKIFVVFVVEGLTTNILPTNEATLPTFTCSESSNHKYFAPRNFRGAKYSWFSWLKVWPRMFTMKRPCLPLPAVKAATTNILPPKFSWGKIFVVFVVEGLTTNVYPQMKATLPTFTCSESSNHKYFAPRNFRGAKYSWFSWLKVWPRIFYLRMKRPCLLLPAVKAATTNILPPKFSWGKIFVVFVVEGLTTNILSTNEATLPTFTCSASSNHEYFAPEIFVGQNIRGFRGWRSDHECLPTNESDLAYFYLQWKQQPQIFCPPKFSWGKIFVVFVVEGLTTNVLSTNESDLAYFYLQWKQQPQIFCPPKFSWSKIFVVFVVEGLTTHCEQKKRPWSNLHHETANVCPRGVRGYLWCCSLQKEQVTFIVNRRSMISSTTKTTVFLFWDRGAKYLNDSRFLFTAKQKLRQEITSFMVGRRGQFSSNHSRIFCPRNFESWLLLLQVSRQDRTIKRSWSNHSVRKPQCFAYEISGYLLI